MKKYIYLKQCDLMQASDEYQHLRNLWVLVGSECEGEQKRWFFSHKTRVRRSLPDAQLPLASSTPRTSDA